MSEHGKQLSNKAICDSWIANLSVLRTDIAKLLDVGRGEGSKNVRWRREVVKIVKEQY
jgi:hypothetical protein